MRDVDNRFAVRAARFRLEQDIASYLWRIAAFTGRSNTAVAYLRPAIERSNKLEIIIHAFATRLRVEGGRVVGVDYLVKGVRQTAFAEDDRRESR